MEYGGSLSQTYTVRPMNLKKCISILMTLFIAFTHCIVGGGEGAEGSLFITIPAQRSSVLCQNRYMHKRCKNISKSYDGRNGKQNHQEFNTGITKSNTYLLRDISQPAG